MCVCTSYPISVTIEQLKSLGCVRLRHRVNKYDIVPRFMLISHGKAHLRLFLDSVPASWPRVSRNEELPSNAKRSRSIRFLSVAQLNYSLEVKILAPLDSMRELFIHFIKGAYFCKFF